MGCVRSPWCSGACPSSDWSFKLLPGFDQVNGEVIALALPIHAGMALGLRYAFPSSA